MTWGQHLHVKSFSHGGWFIHKRLYLRRYSRWSTYGVYHTSPYEVDILAWSFSYGKWLINGRFIFEGIRGGPPMRYIIPTLSSGHPCTGLGCPRQGLLPWQMVYPWEASSSKVFEMVTPWSILPHITKQKSLHGVITSILRVFPMVDTSSIGGLAIK